MNFQIFQENMLFFTKNPYS